MEANEQIQWLDWHTGEPHANPMASSLLPGLYCTGNPSMGWVLYSMGGSCWQTRTKPEHPPRPGMVPVRTDSGWVWTNSQQEAIKQTYVRVPVAEVKP